MTGYAHINIPNEDLHEIKEKLKKERRYLIRTMDRYSPSSDSDSPTKYDNTSLSQDYSRLQKNSILVNKERKRLKRIEKALQRMEEDEFGICLICEERINVNRLRTIPYAEMCFDCRCKKDVGKI
jgi:DnaK suppressor protein